MSLSLHLGMDELFKEFDVVSDAVAQHASDAYRFAEEGRRIHEDIEKLHKPIRIWNRLLLLTPNLVIQPEILDPMKRERQRLQNRIEDLRKQLLRYVQAKQEAADGVADGVADGAANGAASPTPSNYSYSSTSSISVPPSPTWTELSTEVSSGLSTYDFSFGSPNPNGLSSPSRSAGNGTPLNTDWSSYTSSPMISSSPASTISGVSPGFMPPKYENVISPPAPVGNTTSNGYQSAPSTPQIPAPFGTMESSSGYQSGSMTSQTRPMFGNMTSNGYQIGPVIRQAPATFVNGTSNGYQTGPLTPQTPGTFGNMTSNGNGYQAGPLTPQTPGAFGNMTSNGNGYQAGPLTPQTPGAFGNITPNGYQNALTTPQTHPMFGNMTSNGYHNVSLAPQAGGNFGNMTSNGYQNTPAEPQSSPWMFYSPLGPQNTSGTPQGVFYTPLTNSAQPLPQQLVVNTPSNLSSPQGLDHSWNSGLQQQQQGQGAPVNPAVLSPTRPLGFEDALAWTVFRLPSGIINSGSSSSSTAHPASSSDSSGSNHGTGMVLPRVNYVGNRRGGSVPSDHSSDAENHPPQGMFSAVGNRRVPGRRSYAP